MKDENILEQFTDDELKNFMEGRIAKDITLNVGERVVLTLQLLDNKGVVSESIITTNSPECIETSHIIRFVRDFMVHLKEKRS
ncbi:MAG: hypothetical protein K8E24_013180 [Methanobacterium paludis]|nr:hypothetical protein [Methanobacterium paludis]